MNANQTLLPPLAERPPDGDEPATQDSVAVAPALDDPPTGDECRAPRLFDLLLKTPGRFDQLAGTPEHQAALVPSLLVIGIGGYTLFSLVLSLVFSASGVWPRLMPVAAWLDAPASKLIYFEQFATLNLAPWMDGSVLWLTAAYVLGLIGAIGVCLPSFYFYGLLAGVRTTMVECTLFALKGMATSAVALIGLVPIYVALMLGLVALEAPPELQSAALVLGLVLPFLAGLWGTRALATGFLSLAERMEHDCRQHRRCFLRRLLWAWGACFTAVTPVMIFTLWEYFAR